jgi:hypothetical protein
MHATMEIKTWNPVLVQIADNTTEPTQLESNQNIKKANFSEIPIPT